MKNKIWFLLVYKNQNLNELTVEGNCKIGLSMVGESAFMLWTTVQVQILIR